MLLAVSPAAGLAQVDTTGVLPNIAPREFEIRGNLEIAFPSLRRQPLVGFNPPPRVPDVPAGRRPFVEAYREANPVLPGTALARPQPPAVLSGAYAPAGGLLELSGGRYFSRAARARVNQSLSPETSLLVRFDYRGTDGHEPFQPDRNAQGDALEGQLGFQTTGARIGFSGQAEGFYEAFDLYGVFGPPSGNTPAFLPQPERKGRGGAAAFRLHTVAATSVQAYLGLRLSASRFETRVFEDDSAVSPDEIGERRFDLRGGLSKTIPAGEIWVEGTASSGGLTDDLGSTTALDGGAGLRFRAGQLLTVSVGGRFLAAFSDTDRPRDAAERVEIGYASPDIRLEVVPAPGVRLYARHRPGVEANGLAEVFRTNPYLIPQPFLRPTLRSVDAEAGASLFAGPVHLAVRGGYQEMPQRLIFEEESFFFDEGFTGLHYARAEVAYAGGSISLMLPGGLYALAGITYRDGRLPEENDAAIPYFASLVGEATLSYAFAGRRGLFQITGYFEDSRPIDRAGTREVGSFIDLDAEVSYSVTRNLGLLARLENLGSGAGQWYRYPEAPGVVGAGLRVLW